MQVTMVGDSITSGWRTRGRVILNAWLPGATVLGYPGKRPEHITEALLAGDLEKVKGTCIVMAGVNSFTLDRDPPDIARNVQYLAWTCAQVAPVVLCSILPAIMWGRNETARIMETNLYLRDTRGVRYLDLAPAFLSHDGPSPRLTTDGVHLTARGYLLMARLLTKAIGMPEAKAWRASASALWGDVRQAVRLSLGRRGGYSAARRSGSPASGLPRSSRQP